MIFRKVRKIIGNQFFSVWSLIREFIRFPRLSLKLLFVTLFFHDYESQLISKTDTIDNNFQAIKPYKFLSEKTQLIPKRFLNNQFFPYYQLQTSFSCQAGLTITNRFLVRLNKVSKSDLKGHNITFIYSVNKSENL